MVEARTKWRGPLNRGRTRQARRRRIRRSTRIKLGVQAPKYKGLAPPQTNRSSDQQHFHLCRLRQRGDDYLGNHSTLSFEFFKGTKKPRRIAGLSIGWALLDLGLFGNA